MYHIKLADGTIIENLELNGNNYIARQVIEDSIFENNLSLVEISDGEKIETYQDMKLLSNIIRDGKSWIVLRQKTQEEIENEQLNQLLADLTEIVLLSGGGAK